MAVFFKQVGEQDAEVNNLDGETQFEDFYRRECQTLYRYVYVWVGNSDDALEVVQESFLNLYQMQSGRGSPAYERALLFRMARDQIVDLHRRCRLDGDMREAAISNSAALRPAPQFAPDEALLSKEHQQDATAAFDGLASHDQECLALRLSGLSYRAIAEIMNIEPDSVSQTINCALRKFEEAQNASVKEERNKNEEQKYHII